MEELSVSSDSHFIQEAFAYGNRLKEWTQGTARIWQSGVTFRNACDISVLYLTGLIPTTPYHAGPIMGETDPIRNDLATCTRNGFLTTSSEPIGKTTNIITGRVIIIDEASVSGWIKKT